MKWQSFVYVYVIFNLWYPLLPPKFFSWQWCVRNKDKIAPNKKENMSAQRNVLMRVKQQATFEGFCRPTDPACSNLPVSDQKTEGVWLKSTTSRGHRHPCAQTYETKGKVLQWVEMLPGKDEKSKFHVTFILFKHGQ